MAPKEELAKLLKIEEKKARVAAIQDEMKNPIFWADPEKSRTMNQEMTNLQKENLPSLNISLQKH